MVGGAALVSNRQRVDNLYSDFLPRAFTRVALYACGMKKTTQPTPPKPIPTHAPGKLDTSVKFGKSVKFKKSFVVPDDPAALRDAARSLYWQGWRISSIARHLKVQRSTIASWKQRDQWHLSTATRS